jgi:hypothetical protein
MRQGELMTYTPDPMALVHQTPVYVKVNGYEVCIGEVFITVDVRLEGISQPTANNYLIGKITAKED